MASDSEEDDGEFLNGSSVLDESHANSVRLSIPFPSAREAEIAYNSLRIDDEPPRSKVQKSLSVEGKILHVLFTSTNVKSLRTSVNSFFEFVQLVVRTLSEFGPPTEADSS